jgi:endonuclease III
LNQTSIKQVRPVVERLFEKYHTHEECSKAKHEDIIEIIRPLGFYTRRAKSIIELSKAFVEQKHLDTRKLPGVGKYALDSYKIFIMGELEVNPTDKKLSKYVEWAKEYNKSKRKDR